MKKIKVTMYMAITANGLIAKKDDDTSWISGVEWNSYSKAVRKAGNLIVGRRTYNILTKQPEFSELKDVVLVVVSKLHAPRPTRKNHFVASSPRDALKRLKGFKTVIVAGGGKMNRSFMAENLVDELVLDVEPRAFGNGIKLFADANFDARLRFLRAKKLSKNEIQLHYGIVK